jgi:hypothetical protein
MSRKKLRPSEAELRESAHAWVSGTFGKEAVSTIDPVPPGWLTLEQLAKIMGVGKATMDSRIQVRLLDGTIRRKKFRIKTSRSVAGIYHYYGL